MKSRDEYWGWGATFLYWEIRLNAEEYMAKLWSVFFDDEEETDSMYMNVSLIPLICDRGISMDVFL